MEPDSSSPPRPPGHSPSAGRWAWVRIVATAAILGASAVLLFARLGHYALWDDESLTALPAIGIWRTGDTYALLDHNLVASRGGVGLRDLRERYNSPLASYVAAPSLGLLGRSPLAARLPFAACGLACVALMLRWLWRDGVGPKGWALMALAILGNVSFFLYFRQCRYHGLSILISVALAYNYAHWDGKRWRVALFVLLSACLMAANYLHYAALYACLGVDYLIWGRRRHPLRAADWLALLLPQVAVAIPLVWAWNPLRIAVDPYHATDWWADKRTLFWWNCRDLNACEFGAAILLLAAPALYLLLRSSRPAAPAGEGAGDDFPARHWLLRAPLILLVYIATITLVSPQSVGITEAADIRYLSPTIPLCMAIAALALRAIDLEFRWIALPLAVLAFGTNVLHVGTYALIAGGQRPVGMPVGMRSTIKDYVGELIHPPGDPYTVAAAWMKANIPDGQSVWVVPSYRIYPLLFLDPGPVYAWQLPYPPSEQFRQLPPIHFQGRVPPDYLVVFGPPVADLREELPRPFDLDAEYAPVATLDYYWHDLHRPELFWRSFEPITGYNKDTEAIYIFKRTAPPPG
jgi:hypothetical protein